MQDDHRIGNKRGLGQARSCQFMGLELGQKDGPFIYDNAQEWRRTRRRSYEATKRAAAAEVKSTDSSSHAPVFLGHIYDFLLDLSIPAIAYSVYIPRIRPLGFEGPVPMHSSHPPPGPGLCTVKNFEGSQVCLIDVCPWLVHLRYLYLISSPKDVR